VPRALSLAPLIIGSMQTATPLSSPASYRFSSPTRECAPIDETSSPGEMSDDGSRSMFDEALSSSGHTDITSEEMHTKTVVGRSQSLSTSMAGTVKQLLARRQTSNQPPEEPARRPSPGMKSGGDALDDASDGFQQGFPTSTGSVSPVTATATGPSLLRRSLTAMSIRRRTKSSPTPVGVLPNTKPQSDDPAFLSPYWTKDPTHARSSTSVILEHPPVLDSSPRSGIDLYRVEPTDAERRTLAATRDSSHGSQLAPPERLRPPSKTRRSLFSQLNPMTPIPN